MNALVDRHGPPAVQGSLLSLGRSQTGDGQEFPPEVIVGNEECATVGAAPLPLPDQDLEVGRLKSRRIGGREQVIAVVGGRRTSCMAARSSACDTVSTTQACAAALVAWKPHSSAAATEVYEEKLFMGLAGW